MILELIRLISDGFIWFSLNLSQTGFPRPLTSSEERECFSRMAAGERSARDELISHNLRLVVHVTKKYLQSGEQDDLVSIGTIGLIKAVETFNPEKGTRFATYAARCIENEVLMQFRSERKTRGTVYLGDPLEGEEANGPLTMLDVIRDESDLADDCELRCDVLRLRELVATKLYGRERRIIELRYGISGDLPLTQQQVARRLGISRSYVSRIEKKTLERLRQELKN
ncbi:MAG: sigma-70 family RNA polymerase sigma factor [Oscillospiraceae bacterium]